MSERTPHHVQEPQACPFVALADDRDRRLDVPDDRHRCYAEPEPQPRALAHQDTFCLAPAFAACPIFLDWAARAAADPIATRRQSPTPAQLARPSDLSPSQRPTDPASRGWAAPPPWSAEQMGAFDDPPDPLGAADPPDRDLSIGGVDSDRSGSGDADRPTVPLAPASSAPSFLAGRSRIGQPVGSRLPPMTQPVDPRQAATEQPPRPSRGPSRLGSQARPAPPRRPQDQPEWSQPRRHEAYPTLTTRMRMQGTPPIAVGIVGLALAALLLYFLPGFLAGTDPADPTPTPSQAAVATPTPVPTPPPEPTPQVYVVVGGDNMLRIARMFGLTVEQVACFNDIEDVNRLQVGQELLIPEDDFQCPGGETASPGPGGDGSPAVEEESQAP